MLLFIAYSCFYLWEKREFLLNMESYLLVLVDLLFKSNVAQFLLLQEWKKFKVMVLDQRIMFGIIIVLELSV